MKEVEERKKRDATIRANFAKHRAAVSGPTVLFPLFSIRQLDNFSATEMEVDR